MKLRLNATAALTAYGVTIATLLGGLAVTQAVSGPKVRVFDTIDVQRINWREPDGTLRMVIANSDRMPGLIVKGKEYRHASRGSGGMLFFNDEGTENGGFNFNGAREGAAGYNSATLTFDKYMQDQVLIVSQDQGPDGASAGVRLVDRPDHPMDYALISRIEDMPDGPEKQAAYAQLNKTDEVSRRLFLGKRNGAATVTLHDAKAKARLTVSVDAKGQPAITFLDQTGKVLRTIAP